MQYFSPMIYLPIFCLCQCPKSDWTVKAQRKAEAKAARLWARAFVRWRENGRKSKATNAHFSLGLRQSFFGLSRAKAETRPRERPSKASGLAAWKMGDFSLKMAELLAPIGLQVYFQKHCIICPKIRHFVFMAFDILALRFWTKLSDISRQRCNVINKIVQKITKLDQI